VFALEVPQQIPGVSDEILDPRGTWKDPAAYDAQARKLAALFRKNFEQFAESVSEGVRTAGPTL
jgi:phosphoenolpyruvate carboxykinase (ATP)